MNLTKEKFTISEPSVRVVSATQSGGMTQIRYRRGEREILMTRFSGSRRWAVRAATRPELGCHFAIRIAEGVALQRAKLWAEDFLING